MSALFTPRRADGRAYWRVVYDLVRPMEPGDTITFEDLCSALDMDLDHLGTVYRAVGRAARELRRHDNRSLGSVPTVGYRVLYPKEHEVQARGYQKAGRGRMGVALEVARGTRLEELSTSERQRSMALTMCLQGICMQIDDLDKRQRRTEEALIRVATYTDERLSEQEQQMNRMAEAMRAAGIMKI